MDNEDDQKLLNNVLIGFIGSGNIAQSLAKGFLSSGWFFQNLIFFC